MAHLTPEQQGLKNDFDYLFGASAYDAAWARLLHISPQHFASAGELVAIPARKTYLSPKQQCFISLAVCASASQSYAPHMQRHTHCALAHGATKEEIVAVLVLASKMGMRACGMGVSVLGEVVGEADGEGEEKARAWKERMAETMSEEQWVLRRRYEDEIGLGWNGELEDLLRADARWFAARTGLGDAVQEEDGEGDENGEYGEESGTKDNGEIGANGTNDEEEEGNVDARSDGVLEPKMIALISCAMEAAAAQPNREQLKVDMTSVLECGGTPEEIVQVLQLADVAGLSKVDAGLVILEKEMERTKNETDESGAPTFEYER